MRTNAAFREFEELVPTPIMTLPAKPPAPEQRPDADWRNPADMPAAVHGVALACWLAFLSVFWITFAMSANAEFMVAISTVYAVVFFGVPTILTRMSPKRSRAHPKLRQFLNGRFDTLYGGISGFDALVQVIVVPAALTVGGIGIAIAIHAARAAH
ncbi:MAG: hypothetical protein JSR60_18670 [Proteobacteria bacterium]|nr:hypothetical protein [Pseudomonadota bacterium]